MKYSKGRLTNVPPASMLYPILIWAVLVFVLPFAAAGQSDRPCGAPLIDADQCTYSNVILLGNTSFQADAPLTGCSGNYTRDGWVRFVAPSADITISRSAYCYNPTAPCIVTHNPAHADLALYQEGPDCNNLSLVQDCPPSCFVGIGCVSAGFPFMEAFGFGDHFTGLTSGETYYLRVLWDSISMGPPDTLIINIVNNVPCNICPPCGLGFGPPNPLAVSPITLQGIEVRGTVELEWEFNTADFGHNGQMEIFRKSGDADEDWVSLAKGIFPVAGKEGIYEYTDFNPPASKTLLYRIGTTTTDGEHQFSNAIRLRGDGNDIVMNWSADGDGYSLATDLPTDGELEVVSLDGKVVAHLQVPAGSQEFKWPSTAFAAGIYLLQAHTSTSNQSIKIRVD